MKINIEQLKCIRTLLTSLADDNIDAEWDGYLNDEDDNEIGFVSRMRYEAVGWTSAA